VRPHAVYWIEGYTKSGEKVEAVESTFSRPITEVVKECEKTPKETLWQKIKKFFLAFDPAGVSVGTVRNHIVLVLSYGTALALEREEALPHHHRRCRLRTNTREEILCTSHVPLLANADYPSTDGSTATTQGCHRLGQHA